MIATRAAKGRKDLVFEGRSLRVPHTVPKPQDSHNGGFCFDTVEDYIVPVNHTENVRLAFERPASLREVLKS